MVLWLILGMLYYALEGLWRIRSNGGWANIAMLPIGGLCGALLGQLHRLHSVGRWRLLWQSILGACLVLVVEFVSGCVLNLWLGLDIWDYADIPLNLCGQVCLGYGLLWLLLVPFVFWAHDMLCFLLWGDGQRSSIAGHYRRLFTLK